MHAYNVQVNLSTYLVGLFYSDSNSLPPQYKEFKSYNLIPSRKSGENQTGL